MPGLNIVEQQRYWRRSILIPLWTQQLLIQIAGLAIFWVIISAFWQGLPIGHGGKGDWNERAILGTFFALYLILFFSTIAEVVLYNLSKLHSTLYLGFQIAKTATSIIIWIVLFVYPFVVLDSRRQPVAATFCLALLAFFVQIPLISALVHAVMIKHEEREHDFVWDEVRPAENAPSIVDVEPTESTPLLGLGGSNA